MRAALPRLKMGPIQDRHLVEINPLISQFENTLANEQGLLVVIYEGDQRRLDLEAFALRTQRFRELSGIRLDCCICDRENFGNTAIVGLDAVNQRVGIALREIEDVLVVRTAP